MNFIYIILRVQYFIESDEPHRI